MRPTALVTDVVIVGAMLDEHAAAASAATRPELDVEGIDDLAVEIADRARSEVGHDVQPDDTLVADARRVLHHLQDVEVPRE